MSEANLTKEKRNINLFMEIVYAVGWFGIGFWVGRFFV